MNIVIEAGRLTRDPEISYSSGQNGQFCVARYTLAVDGARNANGEQHTDFIWEITLILCPFQME